ncbi:MAG: hypothetical protein ACREFS_04620 [Acetobacteraceae bacterium]
MIDIPEVLRLLGGAGSSGLLAIAIDYLHPKWLGEDEAVAASVRYLRTLVGQLNMAVGGI